MGSLQAIQSPLGLGQLVEATDWGEFFARLYNADVLPVVGADGVLAAAPGTYSRHPISRSCSMMSRIMRR